MANPKAQIYSIPLQGEGSEINLTTYKTDISQFNGFNSKNAPFYGGTLSPMWYKKEDTISTETYIAPNGDNYYVDNGNLYKNGASVMSFSNKSFSNRIVEDDYYDYREDEFYIKKGNPDSNSRVPYMLSTPYGQIIRYIPSYEGNKKTYLYKYTGNGRTNTPIYCAIIDDTIFIFTSQDVYESRTIDYDEDDVTYVCICNSGSGFDCLTFCVNGHIVLYNETDLNTSTEIDYSTTYNDEHNFIYVRNNGVIESYQLDNSTSGATYAVLRSLRPSSARDSLVDSSSLTIRYRVVNSAGNLVDGNISTLSTPKTIKKLNPTNLYFTQYCEGSVVNAPGHKVKNLLTYCHIGEAYGYLYNFTKDDEGYINSPFGYAERRQLSESTQEWRLLYNQGNIQNISFAEDQTKRGTIIAPWFTISNDKNIYVDDNSVTFYSEELKKWSVVSIQSDVSNKITVVDNNYIIVNTTSFDNAYIISENRKDHFADDWNNRIGPRINPSVTGVAVHYLDDFDTAEAYIASAVNPKYDVTGNPFCSLILNPVSVKKVGISSVSSSSKEKFWPAAYGTYGISPVDVYIDMNYAYSLNVDAYWGSGLPSTYIFINSLLEGTTYPVEMSGNIFMNIPIIFDYIPSATNQDLVKLVGNVVYPISYYNNQPIFLIPQNAENSIYGITDSFVIQGQPYAIANNKIVRYTISNSSITEAVAIMDVSGLTYISATPYQAIFWSETNRTFYSFTGDRLVNPIFQADSITTVGNNCIYNPATGSVIVPTNLGLFFLGIASQFILDKVSNVGKIYSLNNGIAVITPEYIYYLSYNELGGYSAWPIKLDTKFYGLGNNMLSVNDTLYMMLFDESPSKGQVKLKVTTLTNIGMTTEEKVINIKESDWDKITNTYYLRYQPKNQRSIGASYHIESDFRIGSISIGNKPDTIQISNNNF